VIYTKKGVHVKTRKVAQTMLSLRKKNIPLFSDKVLRNWAIAGGTLSLSCKILFCLWILIFLGHFTKRVRSRPLGRMSLPTEKFFTRFSYKGNEILHEGFLSFLAPPLAPDLPVALDPFSDPFVGAAFFPAGSFFPLPD
jgi:hypothetical protein